MNQANSTSVSPAILFELFGTGNLPTLLDVRTHSEYASAHVPAAKSIPLHELNVESWLAQHKNGTPIYVLCQAGARAAKAIQQFEHAGCEDCVLVEGGTQAWIDARLPVHRNGERTLPIMRQVQIVVGSLSTAGAILALTVNRWFAGIPLVLGCGLLFAGITGTCGMALLLARMPWNRAQSTCSRCSVPE